MKKILLVTILMATTGCASNPDKISSSYVSPLEYADYNCKQIGMEMKNVNRRANELYGTLKKEADADSAQMAAGLILFWPALLFLEGGDGPEAQEYARLKGQREALEDAAVQKECDPSKLPVFEKPPEPEKPAKKKGLNE